MVRHEVEERSHIAETLRTTRERLELSIERAAADAGVPLRYARLLEGETIAGVGISDELYLIPFFRRYATALGLPAEDLLPDFLGQVQELPPPSAALLHARPRMRPRLATLWRPLAIVVAIAAATLVIVRHAPERPSVEDDHWNDTGRAAHNDGPEAAADAVATPTASAAAVEVAAVSSPAVDAAPVAPLATAANVAADEPPRTAGRELRITAAQETWLSLGIDDETKHNIILQPGETRSWTASRGFILTIGNAGGITVTIDGRELPPLGRPGQVVRDLRLPAGETSPG